MTTPGLTLDIPVRWGDMDAIGHVNNIVYFQYCESARIAYFDAIGIEEFKVKPTDGTGVVAANLNFRKQVHYPATIQIEAHVSSVSRRTFRIAYKMTNKETGDVVAGGVSVSVWVDYDVGKSLEVPKEMLERFAEFEQNPSLLG